MKTDLESYLKSGMENILRGAMNISRLNVRQSMFMAGFARSCKIASAQREELKSKGEHIPPFLIASITAVPVLPVLGCEYKRYIITSCVKLRSVQNVERK